MIPEMVFRPGGIPKIRDFDSNPLVTLQSTRTRSLIPETLARLESMDMGDVDNGTSDVVAVEADDPIDVPSIRAGYRCSRV